MNCAWSYVTCVLTNDHIFRSNTYTDTLSNWLAKTMTNELEIYFGAGYTNSNSQIGYVMHTIDKAA